MTGQEGFGVTEEEAAKCIKAFVARLAEAGYVVQVFAQRQEGPVLSTMSFGAGNVFARRKHAEVWAQHREDMDDLLSCYVDDKEPERIEFRGDDEIPGEGEDE